MSLYGVWNYRHLLPCGHLTITDTQLLHVWTKVGVPPNKVSVIVGVDSKCVEDKLSS